MKKYYYLLLAPLAAFMGASCSDEVESGANDTAAVKSGQPICLVNKGDETTNNGKKKLHYGQLNGTKWPVCWDVNDAADVLCPEARWSNNPHSEATDVPSVPYKVSKLTGTSGTIEKAGDKELCWGQANAHHFFQAFPAGAVDLSDVTKGKYGDNTDDYSANFTATISQSQVIPADSIKYDEDSKTYTARNMNYAVLVGTDRYMREELDEKEPIHLHYNTAFTAVEVTIGACGTGVFDGDVITAVDITNATTNNTGYTAIPLAGEFTGTVGYSGGSTYANNFANSTTPSKLFNNVRIDLSAKPVTLEANSGKTLKVTAFLLPTAGAQVKVTVNRRKIKSGTPGAPLTISKSFKSGSSDEKALAAGKVNQLGMGALPTTETNKIDGTNWMSVLPDETYLSQMSIPGVYDCGAYDSRIHGSDRAQINLKTENGTDITNGNDAEQMKAYLRAGDRVFDFKLNSSGSGSNVTWQLTRMTGSTTSQAFSFENMVSAAEDWLDEHQTECIICVLSDYNTSKTHKDAGYYTASNAVAPYVAHDYKVPSLSYDLSRTSYKEGIRDYIIKHTPVNMLLLNYTPDVTIGEVRGKMVIINETEYDNPVGLCVKDFTVNTKPNNSSWYQDTRTIENEAALTEHTFGTGGTMYIQDFNNLQRRGTAGTIESGATAGSSTNFDADVEKKKGYITTAFEQAKNDNTITNWYLISTACRGWVNSTQTTYQRYPNNLWYDWAVESGNTTTSESYQSKTRPKKDIRNYVKDIVNSRSKTTYQRLGFVLSARVGQEAYNADATGTDRSLEQMIWENNYVGNGPLKKTAE